MKKRILGLVVGLLLTTTCTSVYASNAETFIKEHKIDVIEVAKEYNVFASLMMAQAMLESGYGDSILSKDYNNFFGMKGSGVTLDTKEYDNISTVGSFQVYDKPIDSFKKYAKNFYENKDIYKSFFDADNPIDAAKALDGVYSTSSGYSDDLISIMNAYNLYALDNRVDQMKNDEKVKDIQSSESIKKFMLYKDLSNINISATACKLYNIEKNIPGDDNEKNYLMNKSVYYNKCDIARLYNLSNEQADILIRYYVSSAILPNYKVGKLNDIMVRSLNFNKFISELF